MIPPVREDVPLGTVPTTVGFAPTTARHFRAVFTPAQAGGFSFKPQVDGLDREPRWVAVLPLQPSLAGQIRRAMEMDDVMARMQAADEANQTYGGCGPRLNPEVDASEWIGKDGGPAAKLENEKEPGQTIAYEDLIQRWTNQ